MSAFYTFAEAHPLLTFFLGWLAAYTAISPFRLAFRAWNRTLRSRNISARGWPPGHLDADGDFRKADDQ